VISMTSIIDTSSEKRFISWPFTVCQDSSWQIDALVLS
jgi:hypothetical protein